MLVCAPFPFPLLCIIYLADSEQIRKYWNAYKPNVPLEMLQTPPGSIVIPGLAGMHYRSAITIVHDVDPFNLAPY